MEWTNDLRNIVYSRLAMEFGPLAEWELTQRPKQDRARYDLVLEELATYLQKITGEDCEPTAVSAQVHWRCTGQKQVVDVGGARNFVLNKAAALEAGFIGSSDLPNHIDIHTE